MRGTSDLEAAGVTRGCLIGLVNAAFGVFAIVAHATTPGIESLFQAGFSASLHHS